MTIGFEAGRAGLARRGGAAARRADRAAERARRPVRDRADRHDREPRRRDQEPRGLRGAGRDRPDRGARRARGRRPDEGRGADQARARAALDRARLRGALVQPGARGDRRVRRQDAGARRGRGRVELRPNAAVVTGRRSPHMLYAEQLASYGAGETFPARGRRGLHQDRVARGGAGRRPRARRRPRHDALERAGRPPARPGRRRLPARRRRRAAPVRLRGDRRARAASPRRRPARRRRARRGGARLAEIAAGGGIEPEDEDVHTAIERLLGDVGRKIHAGRSRNDQVAAAFRLYVADAAARGAGGDRGARPHRARPGRGGRRDADAGLHASPARAAGDGRPSPARLGGDARARPRPLRRRRGGGGGEPARRRRAGRVDARAARARAPAPELARRGRRPRLRARLPLRGRGLLRPPLPDRRGARALDDGRVRLRPPRRRRRRRARR